MVKPQLPSAYELVVLAGERDPLARAIELAGEPGFDGTLVWADRPDRLSLALLLEPEAPLAQTLATYYVFALAAGDGLGALAAPAFPLAIRFPNLILFDGLELARLRCAWPETTGVAKVPAWIVFGLEAELKEPAEPGEQPHRISLAGAGAVAPLAAFVEAVARYFLVWLERYERRGFRDVQAALNQRLERRGETATLRLGGIEAAGVVRGFDELGRFEIGGRTIALHDLPPELLR